MSRCFGRRSCSAPASPASIAASKTAGSWSRSAYALLDLITYFTAGKQEVRAWTITRGTLAPQAAGKIHSDFERGFIRAEVMHWGDLVQLGSEAAVKAKGLMRVEGKEYTVQDGDVMHFRFNV